MNDLCSWTLGDRNSVSLWKVYLVILSTICPGDDTVEQPRVLVVKVDDPYVSDESFSGIYRKRNPVKRQVSFTGLRIGFQDGRSS